MTDDHEGDETDRVPDDGPFRRLIIDARSLDPVQRARAVEILTRRLGHRADSDELLVFVTRLRGGGARWYVLATTATGQELPRELLDEVAQELSGVIRRHGTQQTTEPQRNERNVEISLGCCSSIPD